MLQLRQARQARGGRPETEVDRGVLPVVLIARQFRDPVANGDRSDTPDQVVDERDVAVGIDVERGLVARVAVPMQARRL